MSIGPSGLIGTKGFDFSDSALWCGIQISCIRSNISFIVSPGDRQRLSAIVAEPKSPQKHVWLARIVLPSGDGLGTSAIMAETGRSNTCVGSGGNASCAMTLAICWATDPDSPAPFAWKSDPVDIIAARNKEFQTLEPIH